MRKNQTKLLLLISVVCCFPLLVDGGEPSTTWHPLKVLIGTWEGVAEGQPGKGTALRTYQFVLKDKFIQVNHTATYPPQEKNPKGEIHEDMALISFDKMRKAFVMRQFHVESFVTHYAMEPVQGSRVFTFVSESIENIPTGWRARETYTIINENEFTESFDLAEPGKDFEVYSKTSFKRKSQQESK